AAQELQGLSEVTVGAAGGASRGGAGGGAAAPAVARRRARPRRAPRPGARRGGGAGGGGAAGAGGEGGRVGGVVGRARPRARWVAGATSCRARSAAREKRCCSRVKSSSELSSSNAAERKFCEEAFSSRRRTR